MVIYKTSTHIFAMFHLRYEDTKKYVMWLTNHSEKELVTVRLRRNKNTQTREDEMVKDNSGKLKQSENSEVSTSAD